MQWTTRSRRASRSAALVVAAALSFSACAGPVGFGGRTRVSPEEQAAFQAALAELPGDPAAAEDQLEAFLRTYPDSALADDAGEELARLALVQGRRDDAFRWLDFVVERYPDGDRADSVRVRLARWEAGRNDLLRARTLLADVRENRLDRSDRRAYYRLQARLADDPVDRIVFLAGLRATVAEELADAPGAEDPDSAVAMRLRDSLAAVDAEIDSLLLGLEDEQLGRAAARLEGPPPAARLRLVLARRALDRGEFEIAQRWVSQARRYALSPEDDERLASLELRLGLGGDLAGRMVLPTWREAAAQPRVPLEGVSGTLGVVLPLSGRYGSFGNEALRGVMLAAGIFEPGSGETAASGAALPDVSAPVPADREVTLAPGVRLVVRDTAGSPERAAAAVREIAERDDVVAIVGPIFSDECEAAAREAEGAGIPLLTLSSRVELSRDRDWVFRMRITPDDEVGYLVDHTVDAIGAKRFAVLYPETRYGRGMRSRYWAAVLERGGQIVAAASYDPEETDFSDAIRSMVGFDLLTRREVAALEERAGAMRRGRRLEPRDAALLRRTLYEMLGPEAEPLPPIVDFDVLFIPDSSDRIQLIAPQLAYHEVENVQLLGSGEWYDPKLLRVARSHVRGAIISAPFHRDSAFRDVREFVSDYEASFGVEPDAFASDAFDAARLVLEQIARGHGDRDEVRDGLLRVRGYPGVSGVTSIEPDGNARKRPFLLQVRGGRFVGID
jgi:ABC-type branched-subunit amino acid transport system substrate-binding protein